MSMLHASRSHQQREGLQARISLAGFSPPPPVCVPHQYFSNSSRATSPNRASFRQCSIKVVLVHMFFPAEVGRSFADPNTKKQLAKRDLGFPTRFSPWSAKQHHSPFYARTVLVALLQTPAVQSHSRRRKDLQLLSNSIISNRHQQNLSLPPSFRAD